MVESFEIVGYHFHFVSMVVGYILGVFLTYNTFRIVYLEDET